MRVQSHFDESEVVAVELSLSFCTHVITEVDVTAAEERHGKLKEGIVLSRVEFAYAPPLQEARTEADCSDGTVGQLRVQQTARHFGVETQVIESFSVRWVSDQRSRCHNQGGRH